MTNEPEDHVLDAFDRELRALLRVEPSSDCVAVVRARLAEARPSRGAAWWLVPALAAGLVGVLVARFALRKPPAPVEMPRTMAIAPAPPAPNVVPDIVPAPVARAVAPPPRRVPPAQPEVIVPPGEERALLAFVAAANARSRRAVPLTASADADDLAPPASIDIAPLETAPLADPAGPEASPRRSDS